MAGAWSPHSFLDGLSQEWLSDIQDFLHIGLPKLIFIALGTWALIFAVNFVTGKISRVVEARQSDGNVRNSQVRTLTSVVRATGISIVIFLAVLQIMENVLNFNLAPLLASAGVAGIALGLAAQTLVKDLLNGIFILVEDQYTVGDVVTLAGLTGTVAAMSLRKTTVRAFDGTLYVIPNSQITTVANQSREYSVTTLNISVDFSAHPDKVIPLLQKIALEVRNEPAYKQVFVEDPKILGVDSIRGSEVIYPIQVKTLARQQFDAVREMQRRIRLGLEDHRMLPGSPYRVVNHAGIPEAPMLTEGATKPAVPDPTTAKPNETSLFGS